MVVKNQIKLIKSLQQKKYRIQHGLFVVEGIKMVRELLESNFRPHTIYTTVPEFMDYGSEVAHKISETDLKKISSLHTPNKVLAILYIPKSNEVNFSDWIVALDDVRDPGNLGTIIRLCDWFGIQHLVCSPHTVDCYNPKVLQATMGSIARINVIYTDLIDFIEHAQVPVYGTFMDGDTVYTEVLPKKGILIMGNEAKGISGEVKQLIHKKISIPQFGKKTTESLNVATATAILLNELRRVGF
ncbi:MAG: RNA methyltransferase [Saonia sp.]